MYLLSFDNDHLGLLSVMTGYQAPKDTSFDIFWIVLFSLFSCVTIMGLFSITVKKNVEKRKDYKALRTVSLYQVTSQEPIIGKVLITSYNNITFNKPLLSTLNLAVTSLTFIGIIFGSSALAYFTLDFSLRELNVTYAVLLSYIIIDFVFPLLYTLLNKDYRTHTKDSMINTINSLF